MSPRDAWKPPGWVGGSGVEWAQPELANPEMPRAAHSQELPAQDVGCRAGAGVRGARHAPGSQRMCDCGVHVREGERFLSTVVGCWMGCTEERTFLIRRSRGSAPSVLKRAEGTQRSRPGPEAPLSVRPEWMSPSEGARTEANLAWQRGFLGRCHQKQSNFPPWLPAPQGGLEPGARL